MYPDNRHLHLWLCQRSTEFHPFFLQAGCLRRVYGPRKSAADKHENLLRQHRIMGQGDLARNFDPAESSGNAGILCVFPIFRTARMGQKARQSPQLPLCGVALKVIPETNRLRDISIQNQRKDNWVSAKERKHCSCSVSIRVAPIPSKATEAVLPSRKQ